MTMSQAFNEWMRRYIADPKVFEAEFQAVAAFEKGPRLSGEPVYGREMAAYLRRLMREPARVKRQQAAARRNKKKAQAAARLRQARAARA